MLSDETLTVEKAFKEAAKKGERLISIEGGPAQPPINCSGCHRILEPPLIFAPLGPPDDEEADLSELSVSDAAPKTKRFYCNECRSALLGPPCTMCSRPVARVDGLIACDRLYHRNCLRCSHEGCGELLGDKYFEHGDKPYCRAHYLELAAERCAKCGLVVDGGLHALGRAWHPECLRCAQTDEPLEPGSAFMHEGRLVGPTARLKSAPRCHVCNEPAVKDRLFAEGKIYHKDCFKCVHCRTVIGERKYVNFDGEPYLEGCYQKLFGSSAGEQKRTQVHGSLVRHAVTVPLLLSLGASGLTTFIKKHEEMLPAVRRLLRESGVQQFSPFVFLPPAISKPNMVISSKPACPRPNADLPPEADRPSSTDVLLRGVTAALTAPSLPPHSLCVAQCNFRGRWTRRRLSRPCSPTRRSASSGYSFWTRFTTRAPRAATRGISASRGSSVRPPARLVRWSTNLPRSHFEGQLRSRKTRESRALGERTQSAPCGGYGVVGGRRGGACHGARYGR